MAEYRFHVTSTKNEHLSRFDAVLGDFARKLISMSLTQSQTNEIIQMSQNLLHENKNICVKLLELDSRNPIKLLEDSYKYACNQIKEFNTTYKREKKIKNSPYYVEPEEKAIGFKWCLVKDTKTGKTSRKYVQSTFQYVPIIKQLESLFADPEFFQLYTQYNSVKKHECAPGIYRDFCCGSNYQQKSFFRLNPMAVQIQLFTDDYETCDALKSRAGVHKKCGFYFHIRNLPTKFLSKLKHIYLVAICNSDDLKNENVSLDNILEVIMSDIRTLENVGITVNGVNFKGTVINVSFDNLGGNQCFGFSRSFSANHYCRVCECRKED